MLSKFQSNIRFINSSSFLFFCQFGRVWNGINNNGLYNDKKPDHYNLTIAREFSVACALEEKLFKKNIEVDFSQIMTALSQLPVTQDIDGNKNLRYKDLESYNQKVVILRDIVNENSLSLSNKTKALWKVLI